MDPLAGLQVDAPVYLASFSALDHYFRRPEQPVVFAAIEGDLVTLAKSVPDLEFPGVRFGDAATWHEGKRVYFSCLEPETKPKRQSFRPLNLLYDLGRERYLDPYDDYRAIRGEELEETDEPYEPINRLMDAAITVSRYPKTLKADLQPVERFPELPQESLRVLLSSMLTGPLPHVGLGLLARYGFVDHYLPELAGMADTSHSKEHHPEGDVWTHSLETFRYRRSLDLTLTLALLLHDSGKPLATPNGHKRFDGHAEIGARLARKLLGRLGFSEQVIDDVNWLVTKHMFPGALHKLPTFRTERLMADARFPALLELYRCDLESTYRGPDGYYRACKIYRDYLKNAANPYRSADGKKLVRLYVD